VGNSAAEEGVLRDWAGKDSVIASVAWRKEELYRIALIRRSDAGVALLEIPRDVRDGMRFFDSDAVKMRAALFARLVSCALRNIEFQKPGEFGMEAVRDGATPAELGSIRRLARQVVGVDLGEFELPDGPLLN